MMLPAIAASTPASMNLIPANSICEDVLDVSISNIRQPIFIQGKALPHRKQHMSVSGMTAFFLVSRFLLFKVNSFKVVYYDYITKQTLNQVNMNIIPVIDMDMILWYNKGSICTVKE